MRLQLLPHLGRDGIQPGFRHDHGTNDLAPFLVIRPDNTDIVNIIEPHDHLDDASQRDVLTTRNDHIIGTALDMQSSVSIEPPEITCAKWTLPRYLSEVSTEYGWSVDRDDAGVSIRHRFAILPNDRHIEPIERPPREQGRLTRYRSGNLRPCLRQSVRGNEMNVRIQASLPQGRADRRTAHQNETDRRKCRWTGIHEPLHHCRNHRRDRWLVALDGHPRGGERSNHR